MDDNTTEYTRPSLTVMDFVDVITSVSFGMIAVIGSIIMLIAMYRDALFKMGGYLTLAHFSVCDFLNGLVAIYYYPIAVLTKHHYPWVTLIIMFAEASRKVFNVYMPISRFIVIMFPISGSRYFDLHHTKIWLVIVWICCVACAFPMAYPSHGIIFNTEINQWAKNPEGPAFFPLYSLMCNVVPTVLMVVLYPSCFYKLVHQRRQVNSNRNQSGLVSKRDMQILKLFSANSVIFMFYWCPFYVSIMSGAPYVPHLIEISRGIQSAYNPFVYCLLNPSVRNAVKKLFSRDATATVRCPQNNTLKQKPAENRCHVRATIGTIEAQHHF